MGSDRREGDLGDEDETEDTSEESVASLQGHRPKGPLPEGEDLAGQDLRKKLAESEDKYLRLYAEFENFKRRTVKDREEIRLASQERLLREILDVKDHLELALDHAAQAAEGTTNLEGLQEGVALTLRQMGQFLEKFGVVELQAKGQVFDPAHHEAIGQCEGGGKSGTVVQELQKGYLFHKRLLRPARVLVAK